jgi:hypothetical protein
MNVIPATEYGLHISREIEGRLRRCREPVRTAIRKGLGDIAASAGKSPRRAAAPIRSQPPLRFYVYEGYRVAYALDSKKRRVVLLDLELMPID